MFRNLYPHEIEVRAQQVKEKGCVLLLYKDARCDMAILDETVGALNWKREHSRDNKNCTISIWDDKKNQWVGKEDTGTESNTEQEKGLASDSFKRSGFNWGIGTELYSKIFIWVNNDGKNIYKTNKTDRYNNPVYALSKEVKFHVNDIVTDLRKNIMYLDIHDNNNKSVFKYGSKPPLKWYVNEELKKKPEDIKLNYIEKIKSGEVEINEELLKTLRGEL